jgi:hypothetical protein
MRIADVIAMAALVVVILVTLILAGNLQTIANTLDLGSQGNNTRVQLFNNTFTALNLASVGIIIAAAVGILGLVIGAMGGVGRPEI